VIRAAEGKLPALARRGKDREMRARTLGVKWWLLAASALIAQGVVRGSGRWGPNHPLRRIKTEKLVYRVQAWKGTRLLTMDLGISTFSLSREDVGGERQLVLRSHGRGGAPGCPYEATITSRLRDSDYLMRESHMHRVLSGYKRRWLRFHWSGADYLKHKHCEAPTLCHNPHHSITGPDGSCTHCADCDDPRHYVWSLRARHRFKGRAYDFLAALYLARGFPMTVGGPAHTIRVVSNRDVWDIEFSARKEETITVPAGALRCLEMAMTTRPANDHARRRADELEGPFGLRGDFDLYVDKETKQPVLFRGEIDIGTTFNAEVSLSARSIEYFPQIEAEPR